MPTRKEGVKPRGQWNSERLKEAIKRIKQGGITFREAERYYGVPVRTIKRRMENGNTGAPGRGPQSTLGPKNEEKLVKYINRLCQGGFCPGQATVRRLAYEFAVALKLDHKFNKEKKIAGYDWLWAFFRRHPELSILSIKKAQGLSMSRRKALTKDAAYHFYDLLDEEMKKYDLHDKPQNIYTVDESALQLINKVQDEKSKSDENINDNLIEDRKGDPLSIVVCCSAEGRFLPPTLIFKVKNLRPEFSDALPPGSNIYINSKSANINSEIFLMWFTEHFLPQKASGRNVLILNGRCSRVSSIALLELADENNVSLLCLPPHATHALQPLGKSFFGPFKTYFKSVSTNWAEQHEGLELSYFQVGSLICEAWTKSASVANGSNGFRTTGIYPLNKDALPEYLFSASDSRTDINYLDKNFESQKFTSQFNSLSPGPSNVTVDPKPIFSNTSKNLLKITEASDSLIDGKSIESKSQKNKDKEMVNFQKKRNKKKLIKFDEIKNSLTIKKRKKIKLEPIIKFEGSPSDLVECIVKEEFIDEKYVKKNEKEDSIEIQMKRKGSSELINEYRPEPTIRPYPNFNAAEDGTALREAMKGFGTNEEAIIEILTNRSNSQRQEIAKFFTEEYGRNLLEDLKKELGGNFEDLILALMIPPVEYLCKQLNKAMKGLGTDDTCLIEILCSRSNQQVQEIVDCYEAKYDRPLAEHLCSDTSGDFRRFLTLIVTVKDDQPPSHERATVSAQELANAGEGKLGTDEEVFNKIFAHESFPQLRLIFEEYKNIGGRTIEQAIKNELSGNMKEAMLATVECVQHPPTFFAKRLHSAMAGMGTDDVTLMRIIVCRSEIDLENIKLEYEKLYEKTLESAVRSETHGHYKQALLSIINAKA